MSRIKIKNFGPLKETASVTDGWIDIKKVTVFTGNRWGDAQAYDLCVNTDGLEISDVAKLVLRYLELRGLR